jgi:dTDP-L-rhamnose 4-epimerase
MTKVLVTGGAGFIGSHIVDSLIDRGYSVRVFDNLDTQVHGDGKGVPAYLNPEAEFILGDVRDRDALTQALEDVQVVFHQAAAVGVGQSMYEIQRYMDYNTLGTANLLDILVNDKCEIEKLIVASSMSIYGEGKYRCTECGVVFPQLRPESQLAEHRWELNCPHCERELEPLATDEDKPLFPTSIYAISKRDQEEMCLAIGRAYGIPTVALRYFNAYGARQALSNPYTGIAAIFSARIMNEESPLIFEDGLQSRDFTHVKDIVQANLLVLENPAADYQVFNVGTGKPTTVLGMAHLLLKQLGCSGIEPEIVHRFRAGDIRHCYADISRIQRLGFTPTVALEQGMKDWIQWMMQQPGALDGVLEAVAQLEQRGLIK